VELLAGKGLKSTAAHMATLLMRGVPIAGKGLVLRLQGQQRAGAGAARS
jgi:hypothetical protein